MPKKRPQGIGKVSEIDEEYTSQDDSDALDELESISYSDVSDGKKPVKEYIPRSIEREKDRIVKQSFEFDVINEAMRSGAIKSTNDCFPPRYGGTFIQIPYLILNDRNLKDTSKIIFGLLFTSGYRGRVQYYSHESISKICGISLRTVKRAIKELQVEGYLFVHKMDMAKTLNVPKYKNVELKVKKNFYVVLKPPRMR